MIEGQQLIEQATEWIENQKQHIRDYRKRCAEYKCTLDREIKERQAQKHAIDRWATELEAKETKTNRDQMQKILNSEQKHMIDRRMDRQRADLLSRQNVQQKRQSMFKWYMDRFSCKLRKLNQFPSNCIRRCRN